MFFLFENWSYQTDVNVVIILYIQDKWRNLNVAPGQTSKEKSRTPKGKPTFPVPAIPSPSVTMNSTPVPSPAPAATTQNATPSSQTQNDDEANIPPRYKPFPPLYAIQQII